jgi:hypothetical protein
MVDWWGAPKVDFERPSCGCQDPDQVKLRFLLSARQDSCNQLPVSSFFVGIFQSVSFAFSDGEMDRSVNYSKRFNSQNSLISFPP